MDARALAAQLYAAGVNANQRLTNDGDFYKGVRKSFSN